jgi:uncharacterized membrane protein HdeD (DUF308 family)
MTENFGNPIESRTLGRLLADTWWLVALRGVAAVIFGILAFVWPKITLLTLIWLFGVYALINGVLALVQAFTGPKEGRRTGALVFDGIISIAAGVIALVVPGFTALALLLLIAAWAIVGGIFEIVTAVRLRKVIRHEWMMIAAGVISVIFGVLLILQPAVGALAMIWWIGGFAIVFGILLVALSFRLRHWRDVFGAAAISAA